MLRRPQEAGPQLKQSKCAFMEQEAEFLGHKMDALELHPLPNKVTAIEQAPAATH